MLKSPRTSAVLTVKGDGKNSMKGYNLLAPDSIDTSQNNANGLSVI